MGKSLAGVQPMPTALPQTRVWLVGIWLVGVWLVGVWLVEVCLVPLKIQEQILIKQEEAASEIQEPLTEQLHICMYIEHPYS